MSALLFLRMLMDLCIYGAFAVPIGAGFGAAPYGCLLVFAASAAAYAAAAKLGGEKRRATRYLPLLLPLAVLAAILVFAGGEPRRMVATAAVSVPAILYAGWLIRSGDFGLSQDQRTDVFGGFWKIYLGFCFVFILFGGGHLINTASALFAVVALVCTALLLRSLRHDPEVYGQPAYQAFNLGVAAVTLAVAWPFSTGAFRHGILAAIRWIYVQLILPVLLLILDAFVVVLTYIWRFLPSIGIHIDGEMPTIHTEDLGGDPIEMEMGEASRWLFYLRGVVGLAVAIVLLVLLFRFLSHRKHEPAEERAVLIRERAEAAPRRRAEKPKGAVVKVRNQYRRFLKLCAQEGVAREPSDTTKDIARNASAALQEPEPIEAIREIYIRARYDGDATDRDADEVRRLTASLKESAEARRNG